MTMYEIAMEIDDAPTADVVPIKREHWLLDRDDMRCSFCGNIWNICDNDAERFDHCPNCGAKMDWKILFGEKQTDNGKQKTL